MHSIRRVWGGQTFALAKQNEPDGKKSRIRRSKEERRAMVESFIQKYQESNNGNFPSLNLTHKEVGGSFYRIREIVRDIIQENRVLGPAKFTSEKLNTDNYFEQNPLGSIARVPQSFLAESSNENHPELNELKYTNSKTISVSDGSYTEAEHEMVDKEHSINVGHVDVRDEEPIEATVVSDVYDPGTEHPMVKREHAVNVSQVDVKNSESAEATVVSDGYCTGTENKIADNGHVLNDSHLDMINKESIEVTVPDMHVDDHMALKLNVHQELAAATKPLAKVTALTEELIVETFPLRTVSRTTDGTEGLGGPRNLSHLPEYDMAMLELTQSDENSGLNGIEPTKNSNLLDEKFEDAQRNQILNISNTEPGNEETVEDALGKSANHSTPKEHSGHDFEDHTDPQVEVTHQKTITQSINQSQIIDRAKVSTQTNNIGKTYKPSDVESPHKAGGQLGNNSQRISSTTVDRINLESWDGAAKNSAEQEPNPLLAVLKAFVNAFVKFWSG